MLSSRPKKRQHCYGHTEDATSQGSVCLANTLSICETEITQTYEDDNMGLFTGVSAFTRGGGGKTGFSSYPAWYYVVSLNGWSLLLLSPSFAPGVVLCWTSLLVASNPGLGGSQAWSISCCLWMWHLSHFQSGPTCVPPPLASSWGFCN